MSKKAYVVDTNVPEVANGKTEQATPACVLSCIDILEEVKKNGRILIDDKWLILKEYEKRLSTKGQPNVGNLFLQWIYNNMAVSERCCRVNITPKSNTDKDFEEFPDDTDLEKFDRSDRKFVAVALASKLNPDVLNAVDRDWWEHKDALEAYGLNICFLCPDLMRNRR